MTSEKLGPVSRWTFVANLLLFGLASFFVFSLALEVARPRALPSAAVLHPQPPPASNGEQASAADTPERIETFSIIFLKNLFSESRSERTMARTARADVPVPPKPALHGIVIDGAESIAYMVEQGSRRVLRYRVGDMIAGGRLIKISEEGVALRRADGQVEILLNDPTKPVQIPERITAPPEDHSQADAPVSQAPEPSLFRRSPREDPPGQTQPGSFRDLD